MMARRCKSVASPQRELGEEPGHPVHSHDSRRGLAATRWTERLSRALALLASWRFLVNPRRIRLVDGPGAGAENAGLVFALPRVLSVRVPRAWRLRYRFAVGGRGQGETG
jgi:hypothetical protein